MNVLIIGNGFDLAHDLPTSYSDVLNFLNKIQLTSTYYGSKEDFVSKHLSNGELNDYLLKYIEKAFDTRQTERSENSRFIETDFTNTNYLIQEIYDNLKDNVWYSYLWNIYSQGKMKGINWIDFETEISQIVELIDKEEQNLYLPFKRPVISEDEKTNIFFTVLKFDKFLIENRKPKEYKPTFRDFLDKSYADLRRLIRCIEIYLIECVEKIHITKISQDIIDAKPVAVLCFNYTHTYVNNYCLGTKDIHYLHGETRNLESLDNNMVLGIDEYYKPEEKDKYTNYNIYKKFTQRIINETGFYYRDWIAKMDDIAYKLRKYPTNEDNSRGLVNNVYIFGHSLDITDKDVIKDLIDREGVKTTIFYYDKQQQTQQIANLVKMLGQNKFIDMVNSVPQKICFVHQKRMKDKQTIN